MHISEFFHWILLHKTKKELLEKSYQNMFLYLLCWKDGDAHEYQCYD